MSNEATVLSTDSEGIDVTAPPLGTGGCVECDAAQGWWVHLRRCAACGHIGCCDSSPAQHATAHYRETDQRNIQYFEPGESWYWDFTGEVSLDGPELAAPTSKPDDVATPGPADRLPADWRAHIHQ
mgnify:FL=1